MTPRKGAGTHTGRPAETPSGNYEISQRHEPLNPTAVIDVAITPPVRFIGDDGRTRTFSADRWPMPGWHGPTLAAFSRRTGPTGTLRTERSAQGNWLFLGSFLRYLDSLQHPPYDPGALTLHNVQGYLRQRASTASINRSLECQTILRRLLIEPPLREMISPDIHAALARSVPKFRKLNASGYSDGEIARILGAARADVSAIRSRIESSERILSDNDAKTTEESSSAADVPSLRKVAATGVIPRQQTGTPLTWRRRLAQAEQLFLLKRDLVPILILLITLTGRNVETLKDLPAEHKILEGRAVQLRLTKRRRGEQHWYETVTWEIGPPHRELETPGGLYLLLHRLMARGRTYTESTALWSIWRNGIAGGISGTAEHMAPFRRSLSDPPLLPSTWAAGHSLLTDPQGDTEVGAPLTVTFGRIRTTIEVARVKKFGGHLPSAARSNSVGVLFANYLRGDASAAEWSAETIAAAIADAERAALDTHARALAAAGGSLTVVPHATVPADKEAPWNGCADPGAHPATGRICRRTTFLDCFHCGNCVISSSHLPAVLALRHALDERRSVLAESDWWSRYGPVWVTIDHEILPKFTPGQVSHAESIKPADALLDLVEQPWDLP